MEPHQRDTGEGIFGIPATGTPGQESRRKRHDEQQIGDDGKQTRISGSQVVMPCFFHLPSSSDDSISPFTDLGLSLVFVVSQGKSRNVQGQGGTV
jgi:hypothetical protein